MLPTTAGNLGVTVYRNWIACEFEDIEKAKAELYGGYRDRLNPFTGKYNRHYIGQDTDRKTIADTSRGSTMLIWMRIGDADDYHEFDTVEDAAQYILDFYSFRSVVRGRQYGVESDESDEYTRNNYISLYWGDGEGDAIRELTDDEIVEFNESLHLAEH